MYCLMFHFIYFKHGEGSGVNCLRVLPPLSLPAPLDFVRTAENVIHDLNDVVARMLFLLYKLDKYTTGFVTEIDVFNYFDTKIVVM